VVFGGEGTISTKHCIAEQPKKCLDIFEALRVKENCSPELAGDFVDEQAHLSVRFL